MDLGLKDRSVLVTGGTRGIGLATVRAFAAEGARVALTYDTNAERAHAVAEEIGAAGDRALAVRYSLADQEAPARVVDAVRERWGGPDVLVANAFRRTRRRQRDEHFECVPAQECSAFLGENLGTTIRTVQLAVAGMRERGWGRIVLVSSHVASGGQPGQEIYGAAKAALHGFARSLVWDVSPAGVLVNTVCPGLTLTDGVRTDLPERVRTTATERTPSGRLSTPDDIANVITFLCSAANGAVNGELITVAGGR